MLTAAPTQLLILNQMAGPLTWELAEDLAAALGGAGGVALLTGHPDTLAKADPATGLASGVRLFPAAVYRRGSFARRALSWLHYWLQALVWVWRQPATVPLLLFTNPPLLAWLGWLLHRLRGQRYAVMVHDIYPDVLVRVSGLAERHPLVRAWRGLNRRAYERAAVVMTLGEAMAATLARQFDPARTAAGRIEVVYPWADTARIRPLPKPDNWFAREHGQLDKLTVMYSGNMGLGHDIETMLAAARRLREEPAIHFMFIGAGPKWGLVEATLAEAAAAGRPLTNVTLLGWQPEEVIPYSLAAADVALISLEPEIEGLAVPSKSVYALAAGSAIVALAGPDNELRRWIERYGCGTAVMPGDVDGLVAALCRYASSRAHLQTDCDNARLASELAFSREANTTHVLRVIHRLLVLGRRTIELKVTGL